MSMMRVGSILVRAKEDTMGSLVITKTSPVGTKLVEVDLEELILRLQSISDGCNIEIMQLAISSMLDEIEDATGDSNEG